MTTAQASSSRASRAVRPGGRAGSRRMATPAEHRAARTRAIGPSGPRDRDRRLWPRARALRSVRVEMKAPTARLVKVSFSCLMCGTETSAVEIRIDRLTRKAVREALATADLGGGFRPTWDATLTPHCPRCHGRLLLELGSVPAWRQLEAAPQATT